MEPPRRRRRQAGRPRRNCSTWPRADIGPLFPHLKPRLGDAPLNHRTVETLAIGAGQANLALAVAMEELAPEASALGTLLVDTHHEVAWQRGMLLPWTQSQVSLLKDLVTLRNPTSKFSFVNYLHSVGRLDDFINLGTFTPGSPTGWRTPRRTPRRTPPKPRPGRRRCRSPHSCGSASRRSNCAIWHWPSSGAGSPWPSSMCTSYRL
ncbi:SidA/IucD/PvdA family monooxygenase [Peterkaempfera sp. SMS 1(5)a]|uniref:SidA/IucD/PvdA family monooxygenase n=1 Tax=Peterkaempfera podocarpi TaxID=3232308 RepID=UPI00366D0089